MTWQQHSAQQYPNYLAYVSSNVRSILLPFLRRKSFVLEERDGKYLERETEFLNAAIAGCASFAAPKTLFAINKPGVPSPASATQIALNAYTFVRSAPPAGLEAFSETLEDYSNILRLLSSGEIIPDDLIDLASEFDSFLKIIVEKASVDKYTATFYPT